MALRSHESEEWRTTRAGGSLRLEAIPPREWSHRTLDPARRMRPTPRIRWTASRAQGFRGAELSVRDRCRLRHGGGVQLAGIRHAPSGRWRAQRDDRRRPRV